MAQERLTLMKIREILRFKYEVDLSKPCKVSNSTVGEYLSLAEEAGVRWPLSEVGEEELYWKLFPEKGRKELLKRGVTLRLLCIEYKERYPDGYQYLRYCEYFQSWKKSRGEPSMRNKHVGGEEMQVD